MKRNTHQDLLTVLNERQDSLYKAAFDLVEKLQTTGYKSRSAQIKDMQAIGTMANEITTITAIKGAM